MKKRNLVKISMNVEQKYLDKIDTYAENMGVNRSSFIMFIIGQYFQGQEALKTLSRACDVVEEHGGGTNGQRKE